MHALPATALLIPPNVLLPGRLPQVECNPSTNVSFDIDMYRADQGGYLRLAVENAAGSGAVQSVELRKAPAASVGWGPLRAGCGWRMARALWEGLTA